MSAHYIVDFLRFLGDQQISCVTFGKEWLVVDSHPTGKSVRFDKTLTVFGKFAISYAYVVIAALQKSCGSDTMRAF